MRHLAAAMVMLMLSSPAWGVDAQDLYNKKCKVCHTLNGVSGPKAKVGGNLDGVGSKRDEAWLRAYFADPRSKIPDSKMKKMKLSQEQWDALVQFMLQQK
jgi:nitric oxide reductase subunit C